jgi:hypothetical protein
MPDAGCDKSLVCTDVSNSTQKLESYFGICTCDDTTYELCGNKTITFEKGS